MQDIHSLSPPVNDPALLTLEVPREIHRCMAVIIDAVQTGMWTRGVHDLLWLRAMDHAFGGQQRGVQTLVSRASTVCLRTLHWDTIMGDADADRQRVDVAIKSAINEST